MKEYKVTYLDLVDGKVKIKYYSTAWQLQELYMDNKIEVLKWRRNSTKLQEVAEKKALLQCVSFIGQTKKNSKPTL